MRSSSTPPRFVPTLTEVVRPTAPASTSSEPVAPAAPPLDASGLEERVVQRVMQRIDLILERRLREVVGQLILEQTQTLAPRLRGEVELVLRETVSQALAQEASKTPGRP
ncbi:MAG: hypothetical protein Q8R06_13025 [Polaromonas sp.]|uniref:hypothetical protein n=1 Tax=Polaromonas sp. TaxID=1869339 RepID=UPI002733D38B|nr:hypothetical protein [Polaromonas sp.]MDP3798051.1 hypothetical protein [Polaromonas sp.]